jgi:thiol-disulfide isomerase/thioredoxin
MGLAPASPGGVFEDRVMSRRQAGRRALSGLAALILGVAVAACNPSTTENGLQRFATGELAKLEVLAEPPAQPDLMFLDAERERVTLAGFHGKVVVLNLWATWCAPCIEELPSLDRLQAARGSDRFEVVAITFDRSMTDAQAFYDENGIDALALYQDSSTALSARLGVSGIPITVIYDPEGRELARLGGGAEWDGPEALALVDAVIAEAFGEPGEDAQG